MSSGSCGYCTINTAGQHEAACPCASAIQQRTMPAIRPDDLTLRELATARETIARQARDLEISHLASRAETERAEKAERKLEIAREDLECPHLWLDDQGVPREGIAGTLSLVGRIMRLAGIEK